MNAETLALLTQFYDNIDVFLLIFVRIIAFFLYLPIISGLNIPVLVKLILALCLSIIVFLSGDVTAVTYNDTLPGYFVLLLTEFMAGMLMGYILYFIFNIIFFAGQLIDYQIGLSMMSVLDPFTQLQVPIAGNLYYLALSAMLVVSNGLHAFIGAFYMSFKLIPVGAANIIGNAPLTWLMLTLLTEFIVLAVKIAMPIVGAILVIDAMLGIMVKAVPQMNVFVVGMPIKLLAGLALMFVLLGPTFGGIYDHIFNLAYDSLSDLMIGMSP
jgi:flagellar biosynthetic protein FliR